MDPKLLEILKKAKQIDKAAEKYDSSAIKKSTTKGLMGNLPAMSAMSEMVEEGYTPPTNIKKDVGTENYTQAVKNSKLPPAIQKAMLENPIPQPSSGFEVDEDAIRTLRENNDVPSYSEEDEVDMYEKPIRRSEKRKPISENVSSEVVNIDEKYLRKLIASEITKALPKIIENYFDNRLVKENVQFKAGNTIFSGTVMPMPKVKGKNNI